MSARTRRTRAARVDLSAPRRQSRLRLGVHYDPEAFGRFSEGIARFIGTARFLVYQTGFIIAWIVWNQLAPARLQFDPYGRGLVLLTLVLSLQAAYAAPLILLAQTRQADRDKAHAEADAQHREALASASQDRLEIALEHSAKLLDLLEQNTKLTALTQELSARIEKLTAEIHATVVQRAPS